MLMLCDEFNLVSMSIMQEGEEVKQSSGGDKIRKPYTVSEKKLEQLRMARESCKKKREQEQEQKILKLLELHRERERESESAKLQKEEIEKQAVLDSAKVTTAVEPQLSSNHIYQVPMSAEVKEEPAPTPPPVREMDISQISMSTAPKLPRQRNVVWEEMQNAHDHEVDLTVATALEQMRTLSAPPQKQEYLPGTGAGNHHPFENEPGYQRAPYEPRLVPPLKRPPPPLQEEVLDENTIRFISLLPRQKAARVLAAMMADEPPEYNPRFDPPVVRPNPAHVADDFMSHSRVAQSYHPSRLRQSLHPSYESGSQFVWM